MIPVNTALDSDSDHLGARQILWAPHRTTDNLFHMIRPSFRIVENQELTMSFTENSPISKQGQVPYVSVGPNNDPFKGINSTEVGHQLLFLDVDFDGTVDIVGGGGVFYKNIGSRFEPKFSDQRGSMMDNDSFPARLSGSLCTDG